MKEGREKEKGLLWLIPYAAALCAYIIFCLTGALYPDLDNYNVTIVCNGLLGNNNFCQYTHPLLCLFFRFLKLLLPSADVFTALAHILLIFSLGWMIRLFSERYPSKLGLLTAYAGASYLCFGLVLWNVNYTVWAAFFSFVGCLGIFCASDGKEGRRYRILGAILYGFGLMYRWHAAFLFLPFIALTIFVRLWEAHFTKESIRRELRRILPWLIVFAGLGLGRILFYSFEPWKSDIAYDNARITLGDFPVIAWDELAQLPEGADEYTYRGAVLGLYADTETMSLDKLRAMADAGKSYMIRDKDAVINPFWLMVLNLLEKPVRLLIPLLLLLAVCLLRSFGGKRYNVFAAWGALGGALVIILYFTIRGRAPERVWLSVFLAAFFSVSATAEMHKEEKKQNMWQMFSVVLFFAGITGGGYKMTEKPQNVWNAAADADDTRFSFAYETDTLYLVGGWMQHTPDEKKIIGNYLYGWYKLEDHFACQGKLPTDRFLKHFIPNGAFWYGQEYYRSQLKEMETEDPVVALFEQDRWRLWDVSEDSLFREYFFVYLYRRYGDMDVIKERTIDTYPVYRFEKKQ